MTDPWTTLGAVAGAVGLWFVLSRWVLPKLGIAT